jgi:Bacterial Ig-like domain (group 3)/Carboxypeptidase regulatory-like domain/IPT/TIG domain/Bacterial Ig-like domain
MGPSRAASSVIAALAVTLFLIPAASATAATLSGTVSGQKAGQEAEPLAEVKVTVSFSSSGETVAAAGTDAKGHYTVELTPGVYDVHFQPPSEGFKPTTVQKVEVTESRTLDVVLAAATTVHLTGTVQNAAGNGFSGAVVTLQGPAGIFKTKTDLEGNYSIFVPPGNYTLASGFGFGSSSWSFQTEEFQLTADQTRELRLPPMATLTVQVLGKEEEPIPAASVSLPSYTHQGKIAGLGATFTSSGSGTTEEEGRLLVSLFDGSTPNGEGSVNPPAQSGYAATSFKAPPIEGETTVVVRFISGGSEEEGEKDTTPPKLDELAIEPTEIDTGASSRAVAITAHITDDRSGLEKATINFRSPNGEVANFGLFERVSGGPTAGTYVAKVPFERFSEPGAWNATVSIADVAGNQRELSAGQLQELGFPSTVQVVKGEGSEEDTAPPNLDELSIQPSEIDTTNASRTVTLKAHITDDLSGFESGRVLFVSPNEQLHEFTEFELAAGSATNGTYEIPVLFPQGSELGTWNIVKVGLRDAAGHERVLSTGNLIELGLPHAVQVVSGEVEEKDTEAPELDELAIEPTEIDTSASSQTVDLFAHITDDLSGFEFGSVYFRSPSGEQSVAAFEFEPLSGTPQNGSYRVPVTFPQFSEPGAWTISQILLRDQAGNKRLLEAGQVKEMGLSGTVFVVAQPPAVTGIEPASGPETGGTAVRISGSEFSAVHEVHFGATAAKFEVQSPTSILAIAPPGSGTVDVTVTTSLGTSATSSADRFRYSPAISLTSTPNPSVHGQKVTFTAKITPAVEGGPTPLGTVAFVEGSSILGVANLNSKGTATFSTTSLGAGKHPILASYSGDSHYGPAESAPLTQIVEQASTQLTLSSTLNPAPYGASGTLKATVKALAPGAGAPAGTVTFREGETVLETVQLSGSTASLPLKSLAPGVHEISATYSGDPNNLASEAPAFTQTVVKASTELSLTSTLNPAPFGSAGTLKATLHAVAPGGGTPAGTVTFSEGKTVLATVPLSAGTAKYPLKGMAPGIHQISAVYSGEAGYEPSGSAIEQVIVKASTELELTSTLNPAPYGSSATLKATIGVVAPGGGTPSGTVTFREGEAVLATVPLSGSVAKLPLKSTSPGLHEITATYSGDADYEASEGSLTQTIVRASTTTAVSSTKNPAPVGSSGSIKATVKAVAPGGGTPTGTVTFREGESVLAVVPLASGSATYPLKSLPVGTHEILASYGGSANYEASEGAIAQTITP